MRTRSSTGDVVKICEHFRSLQGEGLMMGIPTHFIRTVGCNLTCEWCDTGYASEGGMEMSIEEIVNVIGNTENVCVTGGEPLLQKDTIPLLERLVAIGKKITVETNGSIDVSKIPQSQRIIISMDIKCPSSGMNDRMLYSNVPMLKEKDQLKFVIGDKSDLEYATEFVRNNEVCASIIFTPVGGMNLRPLAEEVLARRLNVRVLPQLHKLIWGDQRAV
jgi:Organic radical activating enzymes